MNTSARLSIALVLVAFAGTTLAQTQPKKTDEPALKGPAVKEAGVPGENRQFGEGKVKNKERMGTEIPHRVFMKSLDALRGDTADASVRLSSEQDSKIKATNDAFMDSLAKYREANQAEARELIQQLDPKDRRMAMEFLGREARNLGEKAPKLGEKGKAKGKPDAAKPDEMSGETVDAKKAEDAKARLREMLEGAPKPADTHAKIFGVLTDVQKAAFQKEMDRLRTEMQDRAGGKRLDKKAAAKDAPAAAKDLDLDDPRIPEPMRERLKNMTPEEREKAIERLRERMKRGGGKGGFGEPKPAPTTDKDVQVPAPDKK